MKNLFVLKFGGSSLATPEQIRSVAQKISELHRAGKKLIVVVSAMGKSTDQLMKLAHEISPHPNRRELDMLLSTGERVSMSLMSMALHDFNCPSISFTGSQAGVFTDGSFSNARITELKPIRVEESLAANKVVVLAGFQGVDPKTKEITTLGRGGSDTTAVAMAAHFKAERCEILKDVDGVFSSDPRIVPEARLYKRLPISALYDFCFWGAKVLNYQSVEWARQHNVSLFVGRSDNFSLGTEVVADMQVEDASGHKFKAGDLLGVNSHQNVLEISCQASGSHHGLIDLENILKERNLPMPQVLQSSMKNGVFNALITLDPETINEIRETLTITKKALIVRDNISTVTCSYLDRTSETVIVSSDERTLSMQNCHKKI